MNTQKNLRHPEDPTLDTISEASSPEQYFDTTPNIDVTFPKDYYKHFDKTVIGQDEAKKALASALFECDMKYKLASEDKRPRLLLAGPTGCGKTMLIESLKQLQNYYTVVIDSSQLTGEGWTGDTKFIKEFPRQLEKTIEERGTWSYELRDNISSRIILVFDEFDKLSEHKSDNRNYDYKKIIQDQLLMYIDGIKQQFRLYINGLDWAPYLDSSKFLIVVTGAFQSLHEQKMSNQIGFFKAAPEAPKPQKITKDILEEHGIMREMLGRINRIITLQPLTPDVYRSILKAQILPQYDQIFAANNIRAIFSDAWVNEIIDTCMRKREGARALRELVQDKISEYLFDIEDTRDLVVVR